MGAVGGWVATTPPCRGLRTPILGHLSWPRVHGRPSQGWPWLILAPGTPWRRGRGYNYCRQKGEDVRKHFAGHGWFNGTVAEYKAPYYVIKFDDGDSEDVYREGALRLIRRDETEVGGSS